MGGIWDGRHRLYCSAAPAAWPPLALARATGGLRAERTTSADQRWEFTWVPLNKRRHDVLLITGGARLAVARRVNSSMLV